jgi:hypothetical protein
MKENTLNKLLIICCLLGVMGCAAKKHLAANTPGTGANSPQAVAVAHSNAPQLDSIRGQQISNFNTFSGKAKAKLNINGSGYDCTLNIRINRDKEIWVSITYLIGIEVARAVITPDSIKLLNRLQSDYTVKPFSFIYAYANSQVSYAMLQSLLIGNAVPSLMNDSTQYQHRNDTIALKGSLQDVMYKLLLNNDRRVMETDLSNQQQAQSLQVNNSTFIQSGTYKLPSQIDIASTAKNNTIQVNLHYVKADFNLPLQYPFSIPDGYTPAN